MKIQRQLQVLPNRDGAKLRSLYRSKSYQDLSNLIQALYEKGWTLTAIAEPIGVSREYVRQLRHRHSPDGPEYWRPVISDPPTFETAREKYVREAKERRPPEIPSEVATYLRKEFKIVKKVNGKSSPEMKERSRNYTHLLQYLIEQGHTVAQISKVLSVLPRTVSFRLARYGFRKLAPSQQHARVKD